MNQPTSRPPRCQSGVTMVELITVLVIVGIMALVALPRLGQIRVYDEIGSRDKVRATLEYARKSAVAQRRNVLVTLAGNSLALTIDDDVTGGPAAGTFPRALALPASDPACGVVTNAICAPASVVLAGPATLTFSPLGQPGGIANCPAGAPVNFCFTVTGDGAQTVTVAAETGYVF